MVRSQNHSSSDRVRSGGSKLKSTNASIGIAASYAPPWAGLSIGVGLQRMSFKMIANGFNASAAAKIAYPNIAASSARQVGYENLTKLYIRRWILAQLDDRWKPLHMGGDEALALVAGDARADPRMLYNANGELLKPHEWPDEIAMSVEGVDLAGGKIKLASKSHARRTILEVTGKVRGESSVDQLVEAMKATIAKNEEKTTKGKK